MNYLVLILVVIISSVASAATPAPRSKCENVCSAEMRYISAFDQLARTQGLRTNQIINFPPHHSKNENVQLAALATLQRNLNDSDGSFVTSRELIRIITNFSDSRFQTVREQAIKILGPVAHWYTAGLASAAVTGIQIIAENPSSDTEVRRIALETLRPVAQRLNPFVARPARAATASINRSRPPVDGMVVTSIESQTRAAQNAGRGH